MSQAQQSTVTIGLAGHTNAGKTTLARTLTKAKVGEIGDRPNLTTVAQPQYYEGLQATFMDCPGFQNANMLLTYMKVKASDANAASVFRANLSSDLTYDEVAMAAIQKCDVVLYLATLEVVPDNSHEQEVQLLKATQPRIIGILSKKGPLNRIEQWQGALKRNGVEQVIYFDAHWDKPSKVSLIYDAIAGILPADRRALFLNGLALFNERQAEIRQQSCALVAEFIENCRTVKKIEKAYEHGNDPEKAKKELWKQLSHAVATHAKQFVTKMTELHRIASRNPTLSLEKFTPVIEKETETDTLLGHTVGGGIAGAGVGAGLGVVIGTIAAGAVPGGLGARAGAALGAKIGGAIAGFLGAGAGAETAIGAKLSAELSNSQLEAMAHSCVALIWALSHHGYGLGPELTEGKVEELQKRVNAISAKESRLDWTMASRKELVDWCKEVLGKIDNEGV